jgi:hypothetical protein
MAEFKCWFDLEAKTFNINFGEFFELGTEVYDSFHTGKKRSYSKVEVSTRVKESFDALIATDNTEVMSIYLSAHHSMMVDDQYSDADLIKDCSDIVYSAIFIAEEYVNRVHQPEENTQQKKRRKSNEELQFTTEHDRLTLRVAFLMKLLVPLVSKYVHIRKIAKPDDLLLDCYAECFEAAEVGSEIKLTNKLYKLVESRIKTTRYSDRTIWSFLSIRSIDPMTLADDFYRKVIVDIMVKLDNNKRVISYFHAVLKNMLAYQFQFKFKDQYSSVDLHEVSDPQNDRLTNFERFEFYIARVDESDAMVEEAKRQDIIVSAFCDPRHPFSQPELEYYHKVVQLNSVQTTLLFLHYARAVGKIQSLYGLRYGEYVTLLVSFRHWLELNGYAFLSNWIMATFPKGLQDSKKSINTKDFALGLINSRTFNYLHDTKYVHVMPILLKNNAIPKLISTIYSNEAEYTPNFEESIDPSRIEKKRKLGDYSIAQVADEVMRFLQTV